MDHIVFAHSGAAVMTNQNTYGVNQITSRGVPGYADVMGLGLATNTVKVNGTNAYQKWEYFREQMGTNNSSAAQWMGINVTAPGQTTVSGNVFVAKNPETFGYDADGNMTNDGRWTYSWDGENRLVNMTSLTNAPTASQYKLDFAYDYMGRRIQKMVSTNNGTSYIGQYTNRFVYDGWNPVAILNPASSLVASFVWGKDLSGSIQGAGGVGGLLAENIVSNGVHFVAYDGNGNVAALVNAASGAVSANYEYGPFGETIRVTGSAGKVNPFRFSTKYTDDESGLVYYGFRYYNASTGHWASRDLIGERGGMNLYGFVRNQSVGRIDLLGHVDLPYVVTQWPKGLKDGHYTSWNIYWNLGAEVPTGFVIQEIEYTFEGVRECGGDDWSLATIWNKLGFPDPPRFHYWEAWRYEGNSHIELGGRDGWLLPQGSEFYMNLTEGKVTTTGKAAFYEVTDLDPNNEGWQLQHSFGGSWDRGGNQGSPMSGDLFSTVAQPNLPSVDPVIKRTEVVTWHPCDCIGVETDHNTKVATTTAAPN